MRSTYILSRQTFVGDSYTEGKSATRNHLVNTGEHVSLGEAGSVPHATYGTGDRKRGACGTGAGGDQVSGSGVRAEPGSEGLAPQCPYNVI